MIVLILIKLLDFLIETFYLSIWTVVNWALNSFLHATAQWLLHRGISVHHSKLAWGFYWGFQILFALSTLTVIVLHAVKDLKDLLSRQHSGFAEVRMKFVDLARQTGAFAAASTFFILWSLLNLIVDKIFGAFSGDSASAITPFWRLATEVIFAVVTFCFFAQPMYDYTVEVYKRLFRGSGT